MVLRCGSGGMNEGLRVGWLTRAWGAIVSAWRLGRSGTREITHALRGASFSRVLLIHPNRVTSKLDIPVMNQASERRRNNQQLFAGQTLADINVMSGRNMHGLSATLMYPATWPEAVSSESLRCNNSIYTAIHRSSGNAFSNIVQNPVIQSSTHPESGHITKCIQMWPDMGDQPLFSGHQ